MKYTYILIFCIIIFLTGCNTQGQFTNKDVNSDVKEEKYTREISDEEQKYIKMVLDKDYDNLGKITENSEEEIKLDYNKIAFAFKKYEEARELEKKGIDESVIPDVQEVEMKYYFALEKLSSVKFIPNELEDSLKELKKELQEKENYYTPIINEYEIQREAEQEQVRLYDAKRELNEKANIRTENPQPVSIGMTMEDVLTDGWGKPIDVNRTTTTNSVNEQWVYNGYKYLYFEDGILVTIQE